ncbi:MAG: enolase [Proteobacteria bacterium]|nr:enolase [Pseudomonadota bacterium]MBU2228152.1 enolase [Pseudomonadota bacterium]MBU2262473.1 enolase [Pseudomonadota bacterium]
MKVASVEAIPFRIPLTEKKVWARGALDAAEHVLVRIRTDDGLTGIAEAPPRPTIYGESLRSIVAAVEDWFGPAVLGLDPFETEKALERFERWVGNPTARAAVEMALADIKGQAAGVPVYKLLGGWTDQVPVCVRVPTGDADAVVRSCASFRDRYGIVTFKIKVGMKPHEDIATLRAVRETMGPAVRLCPDANQGYDPQTAIRVLKGIEDLDITLLEEPCRIDNDRGRQQVAKVTSIPLMGDESCTNPAEVRRQLALGVVGVISIKVARTGFAVSQRIAHLCEAESVVNLCGTQADSSIGVICGTHFAASCRNVKLASELTGFLDMVDDLLVDTPKIENGMIQLTDRPGLGIAIDEAKLKRYRI